MINYVSIATSMTKIMKIMVLSISIFSFYYIKNTALPSIGTEGEARYGILDCKCNSLEEFDLFALDIGEKQIGQTAGPQTKQPVVQPFFA